MAKTRIRKLKLRRFWRWLCVEAYGKPEPKDAIKRRPGKRLSKRDRRILKASADRAWEKTIKPMIDAHRQAKQADTASPVTDPS